MPITRRNLLRGLAGAAALSPFVPLLRASGDGAPPKRLILLFTPHGTIHEQWAPTGGETSFTLGPILAPLERHRDKIVVLDGVDIVADTSVGAPHTKGPPLLWTASPLIEDTTFSRDDGMGVYYFGWNSGPSVDQVLADDMSAGLPYRSLELGVRSGGHFPGHRMIYRGPEAPLAPEPDPFRMFARLFGGAAPGTELELLHAERRSILDGVRDELNGLRPRVAAADRAKLDAHLEAVRDMERALGTGPTTCEGPTMGPPFPALANDRMPEALDLQMRLMASALACDLTRVASLQITVGENDQAVYGWTGVDYEGHHLISHETTPQAKADLTAIYTWYTEQVAHLLDLLDGVPEGDGTMLDNTLLVWGSEIGVGYNHDFDRVPFVLAGGAGGAIPTGRFLSYGGAKHNRLLVSVCHAMGREDILTFGDTDTGSGPLPGLV